LYALECQKVELAAREEKEEGSGQPAANKDIVVDDVTMANAIEAMMEVETITTSMAAPSASTGTIPEEGRLKSPHCRVFIDSTVKCVLKGSKGSKGGNNIDSIRF